MSAASKHPAQSHLAALVEASAALAALPPAAGPAAVLNALYVQVAAILHTATFIVSLYDREAGLIHCGYAVVDGNEHSIDDFPPLPLGSGPTSHVLRGGQPLIIGDALVERERWNYRLVGEGPEMRSMLLAPMTRGGEVVGVAQVQSPRVNAFTANDAAALSVLANQAAAALEAIRQRSEADRAAARARLLDTISRLMGESLDLHQVLSSLVSQVTEVIGAGCAVFLLSESGAGYEARVMQHRDPRLQFLADSLLNQPPPAPDSFIDQLIVQGEPVLITDMHDGRLPERMAAAAAMFGITQALLVPIARDGKTLGAILAVGTAEYPLREDDLALAGAVAGRASAAIEHARLLAEITEQRRFLTQMIDAVPVGIAVLRGPDYVYEMANRAFRRRVNSDDVIGRKPFEPEVLAASPAMRDARRILDHVRTTGRHVRRMDQTFQAADGSRRSISFDVSVMPADRGRPEGVLVLMWDTTDAMLARERLEELARQAAGRAAEMEAIIAHMAEGVVVTATDGVMLLMNEAARRILGNDLLDRPTHPWDLIERFELRRTDGRPLTEHTLRALWQTRHPITGLEALMRDQGGDDVAIRISIAQLPGPDGEPAGAVAILEDVTERRALETAREEFLAQASHELRTPLTSLIAYLQLASRRMAREPASPAVTEAVVSAEDQAMRLRDLVGDLLDASRIRQGRLDLRFEPVDLGVLVTDTVTEQHGSDPYGKHTFHLDVPSEPLMGEWDSGRLRQVFVNLLSNAVKYSPAGGNIYVTVCANGDDASVAVRDEGIGIAEDEIPKLFRPFGRGEQRQTRNIPGFGLGLYICRDIIERHGGAITITSERGKGATFTVTLPRTAGIDLYEEATERG